MQATYCTGPRKIELRSVTRPVPGPDEVVVAVNACGICGSDLHYYSGNDSPPAVCLGHEICGRLETAHPRLPVGHPVVIEPLVACGTCDRCRANEPNLCPRLRVLGSLAPGGLAEALAVPISSVYPLPDGLDLDAAMLAEPMAVAVHGARVAGLVLGEEVLVLGGGAIGLLVGYVAVRAGAHVTVSARHAHQRAAASMLGVQSVIPDEDDAVRAAVRPRRPDLVLETVGGTSATLELALRVVRPGGRIISLGKFNRPITLDPLRFLMKEVRLVSSMTYSRSGPRPDFETALALLAAERDLLAALVTHRVPLADVARAFAVAADKTTGAIKVAVVVDV